MYHHFKKNVYETVLRKKASQNDERHEMGDAVLIYPEKRFFAVADSPSHCPRASGDFLEKIRELIDSSDTHIQTEISSRAGFRSQVDTIEKQVNALIDTTDFSNRTTFTGLFLFPRIKKALLLHNGDSLLYHFFLDRDAIDLVSETNHCLIGKFPKIYQVMPFSYGEHSRFLLATDGWSDILRAIRTVHSAAFKAELLRMMKKGPIDTFISELIREYNISDCLNDDLGLISLNPNTVLT